MKSGCGIQLTEQVESVPWCVGGIHLTIGMTACLMLLWCRSAFKALAYKKYQQVPLYLEWAPADIWDTPAPAPATPNAAAGTSAAAASGAEGGTTLPPTGKQAVQQAAAADGDGDGDGDQATAVVSIYVKNLNFSTTDASLRAHFNKAVVAAGGKIHSAKVRARCNKQLVGGWLLFEEIEFYVEHSYA